MINGVTFIFNDQYILGLLLLRTTFIETNITAIYIWNNECCSYCYSYRVKMSEVSIVKFDYVFPFFFNLVLIFSHFYSNKLPSYFCRRVILDGPLRLLLVINQLMMSLFRCWFSADTKQEKVDWIEKLSQALLDLHTWSQTPSPARSQQCEPSSSENLRESIL